MDGILFRLVERFSLVMVVGWWIMHSASWALVEGYRLWRSTRIKLEHIKGSKEAEE